MNLHFTKMQGAGNDFVVLDATKGLLDLSPELMRRLGDRRFGVGCDQILVVEPSTEAGVDFRYRIFNNSGDEVEHLRQWRALLRPLRDGEGPVEQAQHQGADGQQAAGVASA